MTDQNDNDRPARAPLTLKPRTGSVSSGVVKQSFSHGRSKTVVVETKRRRFDTPAVNLASPSAAERKPAARIMRELVEGAIAEIDRLHHLTRRQERSHV